MHQKPSSEAARAASGATSQTLERSQTARERHLEAAKGLLRELRYAELKPGCWSVRGDGEATADCDVAVDVKWRGTVPQVAALAEHAARMVPGAVLVAVGPSGLGQHEARLKFCVAP